jgi:heme A synthase
MSDQESPTTPDIPADRTAPHVGPTATTTAPAPAAPPRRPVRIGTVVWGLVIAAIGVGILAFALGLVFDVQLAMIVVVAAAGVLLLVGSLATARRRR